MLVDIHTNLFWYPDHLSDEFVEFVVGGEAGQDAADAPTSTAPWTTRAWKHNFDCRPEQLLEATKGCDKVIVFAIEAPFTGITRLAGGCRRRSSAQHADRFRGWCSVDPNDPDCVEQLDVLRQRSRPARAEARADLPELRPAGPEAPAAVQEGRVSWASRSTGTRGRRSSATGPLKYANPILLEDIAIACPDLRMIISHMGHPWETECVVLIRKHPNLYANTGALHYRPLRHYQAFMTALEYGVEHKLIFGSDFPSATPEQAIAGPVEGQRRRRRERASRRFPDEAIQRIIYENWKPFLAFE